MKFELHTDNSAQDLKKRFTIHAAGCKHRRQGMQGIDVQPARKSDIEELRSIGWTVNVAPCAKKG